MLTFLINYGGQAMLLGKFGINYIYILFMDNKFYNNTLDQRFWKDRQILVTGGGGFIGGWLTKTLVELGANTLVLDLKLSSPILNQLIKKSNKNLRIIKGNVCNQALMKKILKNYKIKTVFHLAAQAIVGVAIKTPRETLKTNIEGTWNLIESSRSLKNFPHIVIASSDKAYGEHKKLPYSENTPLKGTAPYDVSKSCADLISQMYYTTYHLPICVTRCGNVFGGGDLNFSRVIPDSIRSAVYNRTFFIRSNGNYRRDYIYIKDIVNAYLILAENMNRESLWGQAFNFGNNDPRSVLEVVKTVFHLMGKDNLKIKILDEAKHEIKNQYLLSKKAKEILGWQPKFTFQEGLQETISWYESYFLEDK